MIELLLIILIIISIYIVYSRNLINCTIVFSLFGLILGLILFYYKAPDVALTVIVVASGASSGIFMIAISKTEEVER
jgi:uncharacterized MnhB-related membrane protein